MHKDSSTMILDVPLLRDHLPELAERSGRTWERQAQAKIERGFNRLFWEYGLSIHPHNRNGGEFGLAIPQAHFREIFPSTKLAKDQIWRYLEPVACERGSGMTGASVYTLSLPMQQAFKRTWQDVLRRALAGDDKVTRHLESIVFKTQEGPLNIRVTLDPSNLGKAVHAASDLPSLIDSKRSVGPLLAIQGALNNQKLDLVFTETGTGRLCHPIQNIRREIRRELFRGWHDYDVQACAPTLLNQMYARETRKENEVISQFVKNKSQKRREWAGVAFETNAPTDEQIDRMKQAITALFFGAELISDNPYKEAMANYLGKSGVDQLKNTDLAELAAAIRQVFIELARRQMRQVDQLNLAGKRYNKQAAESKNKLVAHIYQGAERSVLNCFIDYCQMREIEFIPMHDGFISQAPMDRNELVNRVRSRTGFVIQLDYEEL